MKEDLTWKWVQLLIKLVDEFGGNLFVHAGDVVHRVLTDRDLQNLI